MRTHGTNPESDSVDPSPQANSTATDEARAASFDHLADRYSDRRAKIYERRRSGRKWESENRVVEQLLEEVPEGSKVLDIPVGTGRFFPWFKARNLDVVGIDASQEMLQQAEANAFNSEANVRLELGDILSIARDDGSFDLVICIRFLNLIPWSGVEAVVEELARVSGDKIMIGVRYCPSAVGLSANGSRPLRWIMRKVGMPQYLARRRRLVFHAEASLDKLFGDLGLHVLHRKYVERRWDGTDYAIFLLQKQPCSSQPSS